MTRPERPTPHSRRGPRPLLLHLSLAWMKSSASIAASPSWNAVWPPSSETTPHPDSLAALFAAAAAHDSALIAGIAAYRNHPFHRALADPPVIWSEGETQLLDFGGEGRRVLFVPSLVNRAYILDLLPDASLMRWLAAQGAHPYLLDWGWPGELERQFSLTDYIAGRLERAIAAIGGPITLAGYCMGGLLAIAAALRLPARIKALALLATPWDFHAAGAAQARKLADSLRWLEPAMQASGTLPIDALQTLFTMIDPNNVAEKYRDFARQDPDSARAQRFVAMEDWLADGVPLAAPVARETIGGWYGANTPAAGAWRVAGLPITPDSLDLPCFIAAPARDRLVPPESVRPLATAIKNAIYIEPSAGHIGMIAGSHAREALWEPFKVWLDAL
jgi:polyhydroxyalkanoate synthase